MIALLQRVRHAECAVDGETVSRCGEGLLILLGVKVGDEEEDGRVLSEKIAKLRIFSDENGKMNRSVLDVVGQALVISQFTLLADYTHGNRPDYLQSEKPDRARALYEDFAARLSALLGQGRVETGVFGADMQISLTNDGPVTIVMDSALLRRR